MKHLKSLFYVLIFLCASTMSLLSLSAVHAADAGYTDVVALDLILTDQEDEIFIAVESGGLLETALSLDRHTLYCSASKEINEDLASNIKTFGRKPDRGRPKAIIF